MPRPSCPFACLLAGLLLAPMPARADACDGLAQQIAGALGGRVGRRSGPSIDLRVPGTTRLDLTCRADPIVQASSADATPASAFFQVLATASGIVVGEEAASVEPVVVDAYRAALAERRKSFLQQNGWSASCYTDTAGGVRTLCSVGRIPRD